MWHLWLKAFDLDGTLPRELGFASSVVAAEWFPADGLRFAPIDVWSVPDRDRTNYKVLLPVVREIEGSSSLLSRLGIVSLPPATSGEAKVCDAKAARALCGLKAKCGDGAIGREARRLFSRLVRCLGPEGARVPVLLGRVQDARWAEDTEVAGAWLATDNARSLRNYFPHLQFVDAYGSEELASRLGVQFFNPKRETDHEGSPPTPDDAMREYLAAFMPYLLALADSQRLTPHEFGEIMSRWERAAVMRADNVFLRLKLSDTRTETIGLKDKAGLPILNEVFMPDNVTAWHDVPDLGTSAEIWLPRFATWLADAVLNAEQHAHRLRPLLHALGEDAGTGATTRTDNHLQLFDIDGEQVDHWRKQFNEARMSSEQRDEVRRERRGILERFGTLRDDAELLAPTLTPSIFSAILRPSAHAGEITEELRSALTLPCRFVAEATNRAMWNRDKVQLRDGVLAHHLLLKYTLATVDDAAVEKLLDEWNGCSPDTHWLNRLGFDPMSFAQAKFPGRDAADAEELRRAQHVLNRRPFATLESTPVTLRSLRAGGPGAAHSQTQIDRAASDAKKHERGTRAEEVRAREAAGHVLKAPPTLRPAIDAERGRIAAQLHGRCKGLQPIDWSRIDGGDRDLLVDALWVAKHADCGYDVIDVDLSTGAVLQVEVKSSGLSGSAAGLYLSATELKRARAANSLPGVQYRVEVYLGFSRRIDATAALEAALKRDAWLDAVLDGEVALSPNEFYMEVQVGAQQ